MHTKFKSLKVSIGMNLQPGAWGGGNQVVRALVSHLRKAGVEVSFDLNAPDLDIIFLTEPDTTLSSSYGARDILKYLLFKNSHCIVLHRINNSSEARDDATKKFNKFRIAANKVADHTIFISKWVYERYVESGFQSPYFSIILNGADPVQWKKKGAAHAGKLNIVTHHWSSNANKGFDIYQQLDEMLLSQKWSARVSFTYIGRLPEGFKFKASAHIPPLSGEALANELSKYDIYLTAAKNEAAGMHHIEGAICGLPLLYRESGALPEYCKGFGVSFTERNFEEKLQEMINTYAHWAGKMKEYPYTSDYMSEQYYQLCLRLSSRRDEILARRKWSRRLLWLARTIVSK